MENKIEETFKVEEPLTTGQNAEISEVESANVACQAQGEVQIYETNTKKTRAIMNTKKMATIAVLSTLATILVAFARIPIPFPGAPWLKFDPKDIIIVLGGFIYGPSASVIISVVSSFLEMWTVSTTGWWGLLMNIVSSVAFAVPAAFFYKKLKTKGGAIIGLIIGTIAMTAVMLLFNIVITPIYTKMPREKIWPMLASVFLPFNMLKGTLNSAATMLIYKPLITALRKMNLVPESDSKNSRKQNIKQSLIITGVAVVLLVVGIIAVLYQNKII